MPVFELDWMKFYPRETLADGRFQSWALDERGAWMTLVLLCWTEGSIPAGVSALARLLHVDTSDASRIWSTIGDRFAPHPSEPGRMVSPRVEEERAKALAIAGIRSDAGTKGAKARWNNGTGTDGKRMRRPKRPHSDSSATGMRSGWQSDAGRGSGSGTGSEATTPPPARAREDAGSSLAPGAVEAAPPPVAEAAPGAEVSPDAPAPPDDPPPTGRLSPLPSRAERLAQRFPATAEVIRELDAGGWQAGYATDDVGRGAVERSVGLVGIREAARRLLEHVRAERAAGREPRPWLGWHLAVIEGRPRDAPRTATAKASDHTEFRKGEVQV